VALLDVEVCLASTVNRLVRSLPVRLVINQDCRYADKSSCWPLACESSADDSTVKTVRGRKPLV
jgi:hypothetical protein